MFLEVLIGLLAVMALYLGVLLLIRLQEERIPERRREEIIVRDPWRVWGRPLGPYYSHLPARPLLFW
jgi:hypothetical protein